MRQSSPIPCFLPLMMAELAFNSYDTIAKRTALIMTGQCTAEEYRRMTMEKAEAAQASLMAMASATPWRAFEAAITPWLRSARANAKRLG
jgi:hypothetical protein